MRSTYIDAFVHVALRTSELGLVFDLQPHYKEQVVVQIVLLIAVLLESCRTILKSAQNWYVKCVFKVRKRCAEVKKSTTTHLSLSSEQMKHVLAKRSSAACNVVFSLLHYSRRDHLSFGTQIAKCVNDNAKDQIDHSQREYRPKGDVVHDTHYELLTGLQSKRALLF